MRIKNSIKPYYHYLYITLKQADVNLHKNNEEEMVNVMIEDIVRLDALISLLVYVDNTVPVLRCQKAFAKLKSELEGLYYLFREQKLIGHRHHATLGWQIGKAIDVDLDLLSKNFKSQSNELYLNTINATEQAIADHVSHVSDEHFIEGIMGYFTNCLEEIKEKNLEDNLYEVGYLIRSLLANLHFVSYAGNKTEILKEKSFFNILSDAVTTLKTMHVYQMTLKATGLDDMVVSNLAKDLQKEYDNCINALKSQYNALAVAEIEILYYVRRAIVEDEKISDGKKKFSIHARNLLHSHT